MAKRVLLVTRELLFRSKLGGVVASAGAEVSRDEAACDLAVWSSRAPGRQTGSASSYDAGFRCLPTAHTSRWSCCARRATLARRRARTPRWRLNLGTCRQSSGLLRSALRSPAPRLSFRAMTHSTTVALPPQALRHR